VSRAYDLIFFLTDGSIPTTFAKYNILHFQIPFQHISVHPVKLSRFQTVVCNSDFTRGHIDPRIGRRAVVIYPPVEPVKPVRGKKKKIILSVGRFHPLKKQDVLIRAFRKAGFPKYELVLAGGLLLSDEGYFRRLKTEAKGLAVRFLPNIPFDKLTALYNQASVYWHGAGYRETKPENMEHFGISVVEAMSAGAVPLVYNGGGLPEIVRDGLDGFLWANTDELIDKTGKIISQHGKFSRSAVSRSREFSSAKFTGAFDKLLAVIMK
jgi:glycosyltransferase involved in cell wall biosynthesis